MSFVGSPVASDGRIYFTTEEGQTLVIKDGPEFEQVRELEGVGFPCALSPDGAELVAFSVENQSLVQLTQQVDALVGE